jgi:hypothetical protein
MVSTAAWPNSDSHWQAASRWADISATKVVTPRERTIVIV